MGHVVWVELPEHQHGEDASGFLLVERVVVDPPILRGAGGDAEDLFHQ